MDPIEKSVAGEGIILCGPRIDVECVESFFRALWNGQCPLFPLRIDVTGACARQNSFYS